MREYIKYEIELVTKAPFRIGGVRPVPERQMWTVQ